MSFNGSKAEAHCSKPVFLVVDNVLSHLIQLKKVFEKKYAVHTAATSVEALRFLQELSHIDVLIVNQNMQPMKGTEFLRIVRETLRKPEKTIKMLIVESPDQVDIANIHFFDQMDFTYTKEFDPDAILAETNRLLAKSSKEKRASLRIDFPQEKGVVVEIGLDGKAEIENISENGMFLKTNSHFSDEMFLPFGLHLPGSKKFIVGGRIVRVDRTRGGIGVEFQLVDNHSRKAIFRFLSDYVSSQDLSQLKERYPFLRTKDMIAFRDQKKIKLFFAKAMKSQAEITALSPHMSRPVTLALVDVKPCKVCIMKGKDLDIKFKTSDPVFISFQNGYETYNFETTVCRIAGAGSLIECFYPRVLFYSEKRAIKREVPDQTLGLRISLPAPFNTILGGPIADISDGGASFISDDNKVILLPGTPLHSIEILNGERIIRKERGEVRHVAQAEGILPGHLRYGIQFGIGRLNIQATKAPTLEPREILPGQRRLADLDDLVRRRPEVIRLENKCGEEIVGLLNSSFPLNDHPIPVVLIPPAFGKTKETLFAFALTVITNFYLLGKPIVVIRYDGIRRKGESYKDPENSEPPYEMVNASLSQGGEDAKAVLDWIRFNSKIKASSVTLVTFSLSALEARLILRDEVYRRKVNYWVSCMGTPELRHLLTRVNCGLDLLEQYQLGISLGVMPVLGNLVNVDKYMEDGIANRIATLDQAREDMKNINIPITWIYGEHDHWVKAEFIRDIMGVQADAPREVMSISLGHNARSSEEALKMFGTVTSLIYRFLYQELINPIIPPKKHLEFLRRAEKDRIPTRNLKNRKYYWLRYLLGEENLLGFDVLTLADDYQQLMHDQWLALELTPKDCLLDLGGGTGSFIEHMLEKSEILPKHATIADLVPGALKQAVKKLALRLSRLAGTFKLDTLSCDIEINRFLPVRRFLGGEIGRFEELVDKIENLTLQSAEKIQKDYSPRLHRILRGEEITPAMDEWLKKQFELTEYRIIFDFNQAAQYVRHLVRERPKFRKLVFSEDLEVNSHLPIKPGYYNKILLSLVLSYVFNPVETLIELRRIIKPHGLLVLSSLLPDADASGLFTRLMDKVEGMPDEQLPAGWDKQLFLTSTRSFLNDAQALVELEEAGTFDFFDREKLNDLLEEAGWECLRIIRTFGEPPQGYIAVAKVGETHG